MRTSADVEREANLLRRLADTSETIELLDRAERDGTRTLGAYRVGRLELCPEFHVAVGSSGYKGLVDGLRAECIEIRHELSILGVQISA